MPIYVGEDNGEEIASNKSGEETGSKNENSEVSCNNLPFVLVGFVLKLMAFSRNLPKQKAFADYVSAQKRN